MVVSNPFLQHIRDYFVQLNTCAGLAFTLDTRTKDIIKQLEEKITRIKALGKTATHMGCSVLLIDLSKKVARQHSTGSFLAQDEQVVEAIRDVVTFMYARTFSVCYESFETFVLNLCADVYERDPTLVPRDKVVKFERKHFKQTGCKSRSYYRALSRYLLNHNILEAMKFCRQQFPQFRRWERRNVLSCNMETWLLAATEARHSVTHKNGSIEDAEWKKINKILRRELDLRFRFRPVNDCYRFMIDKAVLDRSERMFASYAYILFKAASIKYGYGFDIFR